MITHASPAAAQTAFAPAHTTAADSRHGPPPAGERGADRLDRTARLGLLMLAAAIHLPFYFGARYGEDDAARIMVDALLWVKAGIRSIQFSEYRYYISPGYIWLTTKLLSILGSAEAAMRVLNALNLAMSIVVVVPVFNLLRRRVPVTAATGAVVYLLFLASFWMTGLYGFPHFLALGTLVFALDLYDRWLLDEFVIGRRADLALIAGLLSVTVLLKADIYLSAIALPVFLLERRRVTRETMLLTAIVGLVPVVVAIACSTALLAGGPTIASYAGSWEQQYRPEASVLHDTDHTVALLRNFGVFTWPLLVLALKYAHEERRWGNLFLIAIWTFLPTVFWALRPGDSARHHVQPMIPIVLAIGLGLSTLRTRSWLAPTLILAGILINYSVARPSPDTYWPSARVFASARMIADRSDTYQRLARDFATRPDTQRALLDGEVVPYAEAELLSRAQRVLAVAPEHRWGMSGVRVSILLNGSLNTVVVARKSGGGDGLAAATALQREGYAVYSLARPANSPTMTLSREPFRP